MAADYDLHLHTCWSYDATGDVEYFVRTAGQRELRCIAITEHHVLDSWPEVHAAAKEYPAMRVIRSAELSVSTAIGSVDLLCYGFPPELPAAMQRVLERYHDWQRQYGAGIVRGMRRLGLGYTDQDRQGLLESYRPARTLAVQGLTHVGNTTQMRHFLAKGYIKTQQEYGELLARLRGMGELPPYPPAQQVVPHVLASGAIIALAHPTGYVQTDPGRIDALRQECRFDGLECAHPSTPPPAQAFYRDYCRRNGLFSTGGSDSHSNADMDALLAGHGGQAEWLEEFLERLK